MDMHNQALSYEQSARRRGIGPAILAITAIGALLALTIALSSAVVQAGGTHNAASRLSAPSTLRWQEAPRVTTQTLHDVDMVSSTSGWSVGVSGTVLYYNGTTWSPYPISSTGRLVDVHMLNANDGFIVDRENNSVYRWNGTQWSLFHTAPRNLNRLDAVSADNVWVAGLGKIYHCNPCPASGGTWVEEYSSPGSANIFSLQMFVGNQGIEGWATGAGVAGEGALVVHYLNGVWSQYLPSPSSNTLYDSFFTVPDDGWAVGFTSTTYVMRYNGIQWYRAYTLTQQIDRMYMFSPNEGWMSGPDREILHFLNGNFTSEYTAMNTDFLASIFMVSPSDGWAVGHSGIMVHYSDDGTPGPTATGGPATATTTSTATRTATATSPAASPTTSPTSPASTATSVATATPCNVTFTDVPSDHTFYSFIRCLACRGIISGYSDGTFKPGNEITRSQIAKMVSNAAGLENDPGPQIFEDVDPSHTFYAWINRLSQLGYMGGYPCGTIPEEPCGAENRPYFRPFANATRGQLAKIVSNTAGVGGTPTGLYFTDVPEDHPFYTWIMRLTNLGVMGGYPCGGEGEPCDDQNRPYFRPYNNVTRGQASKIVANTFFPGCQTPAQR
jgi:photosystem II stability/assembly factor-like uncharacterized protein